MLAGVPNVIEAFAAFQMQYTAWVAMMSQTGKKVDEMKRRSIFNTTPVKQLVAIFEYTGWRLTAEVKDRLGLLVKLRSLGRPVFPSE